MLYDKEKVQQFINERYDKAYRDEKHPPEDFIEQFEPTELTIEEWFSNPIYDKYEDKAYIDFVQADRSTRPEHVLEFLIEVAAMEAISDIDMDELADVADSINDEQEEAKDPYGYRGLSRRDFI